MEWRAVSRDHRGRGFRTRDVKVDMTHQRLDILKEARRALEINGVDAAERQELLTLLDILLIAIGKSEPRTGGGEMPVPLKDGLVSSDTLLSLLRQQTAELDALRKLSVKLTSSLDMTTVLDAITHESMRLVKNTRAVHIFLYRNGTLEFGTAQQSDGSTTPISKPRQTGLTYAVARRGETIVVEDIKDHPLYVNAPKEWYGSIIGIPLKMGDTVVGVMNLSRSTTGGFTEAEIRLLSLLADQAAVAISNASLHQQISRKAYSDTVTGLPNRRALDERLEKEVQMARRTGKPFALVMMDLDGFKSVNDTYGHALGDQVLRVFFSYMALGLRTSDFLARYGGDELTLIVSQANLPSARLVTEKISEKLRKFFFTAPDGNPIRLGISGGIAIFPDNGRSGPELLRAADEALYRAKRHQRGSFMEAIRNSD